MAVPHDKKLNEKTIFPYFLVCEGLSNDDFGLARGSIFKEIWPGAGFKTGEFRSRTTPMVFSFRLFLRWLGINPQWDRRLASLGQENGLKSFRHCHWCTESPLRV